MSNVLPETKKTAREEVSRIVGETAGAVSVCWADIAAAGVFESTQAAQFVDAAIEEIVAANVSAIESLLLDPTNSKTPHCIEEYNGGLKNAIAAITEAKP